MRASSCSRRRGVSVSDRVENLDRDLAIERAIAGGVDHAHAAAPEPRRHLVAIADVGPLGNVAEVGQRPVANPAGHGRVPSSRFASASNSPSLVVRSRSRSSTNRRSWRRIAAR